MSSEVFVYERDQSQWIDPMDKCTAELPSIKYMLTQRLLDLSYVGVASGREGERLQYI